MKEDKKYIVCYGDSNTFGYDPRSFFGGRYPAEARWTDILEKKLDCCVENCGQNGREIPRGERGISSAVEYLSEKQSDILIVMLGSNDILNGADEIAVTARMRSFLEKLAQKREQIILIAPPPMQCGAWVEDAETQKRSELLAKGYQALAQELGVHFADAGEWGIELTFDGVHFSEEGQKAFAEGVFELLKKQG